MEGVRCSYHLKVLKFNQNWFPLHVANEIDFLLKLNGGRERKLLLMQSGFSNYVLVSSFGQDWQ
jgi:hypothetical protein